MTKKNCTGVFDHSLESESMSTVDVDKFTLKRKCNRCGFSEILPRSSRQVLFVNQGLLATKKWAADDNAKELLQPLNSDGSTNEDFTMAYGFNPMDDQTKVRTPKLQGGIA